MSTGAETWEQNRNRNNASTIVFGCDELEWSKKPPSAVQQAVEFAVPSAEQVGPDAASTHAPGLEIATDGAT